MKKIIINKDCFYEGKKIRKGTEMKPQDIKDWGEIWKLNENGYLEDLTSQEFLEIQKKSIKKGKEDE